MIMYESKPSYFLSNVSIGTAGIRVRRLSSRGPIEKGILKVKSAHAVENIIILKSVKINVCDKEHNYIYSTSK